MRMFKKMPHRPDSSDALLVRASIGGDRDAFGAIVRRYQGLLCSLAYSAVGDFNASEDIAQEAFVEAWGKLDTLREPAKLKAWLCGILRFKASHFRRKESRQPVKGADELDERDGFESRESRTEDVAINDEEQLLLWQAMERIPATYREAMVLFYREDRSAKQVADVLDVSEDAVKQRLSRGRKLLQEEMMTFVEGTLAKSKPGPTFTAGVLAAITLIPPPAKAATLSAAALKAGAWLKWTNVLASVAAFSGFVSTFFGIRAGLDQSRTAQERTRIIKVVAVLFSYPLVFVAVIFILRQLALSADGNARYYAIASQGLVVGFVVSYVVLVILMLRGSRMLRAQERELHPEAFEHKADRIKSREREYRSRLTLAGVPLIHIRFGMAERDDKPVFGWVAGGDRAYGLLFAWGGIAMAPISVGIVSVGLVGVGAVGLGLLGLGTVGIGVISFGAAAVGYKAYASLSAFGWESAFSQGFSVAAEGAIGPLSFAREVNNEQAAEITNLALFGQSYLWVLAAIAVVVVVPAIWHSNKVRERMRYEEE